MLIEIVCIVIALILVALAIFFDSTRHLILKVICIIFALLFVFNAAYIAKSKADLKECRTVYSQIERIDKIGIHNYKVETLKTVSDLYNKYEILNDTYNDDFNYHVEKLKKEYNEENKKAQEEKNVKKLEEINSVINYVQVRAKNIENFNYNKAIIDSYPKSVQEKCKN